MKLLDVRAQNYGVFKQRHLDFGNANVVLVHGPNEAGKSTLLQLLRELLFGFPHSSPYAFDGAGAMNVEATCLLRDQQRLQFARRKGRGVTVQGRLEPSGEEVNDEALARLLGHATAPLYNHLFAFSLTELAAGEDSLKSAGLTDAVFGGGLGGLSNLQRVRKELRREHEELFKASARNPPINQLASQIKEAKKQLQGVVVKPREYLDQAQAFDRHQADLKSLQEQQRDKSAQLAHLERLLRAWEPWCQRATAQRELGLLQDLPARFHPGDAATFTDLTERWQEAQHDLQAISTARAAMTQELQGLRLEPAYAPRLAQIKSLEQEIGKTEGFLRDLPARSAEYATLITKMETALQSLHRDWTLDRLTKLRLSLGDRQRVRELAKQAAELNNAIARDQEELEELQSQATRHRTRLASVQDKADVEALSLAISGQNEFTTNRTAMRHAETTAKRLTNEMEQLHERLITAIPRAGETLDVVRTPLASAVEEFRDKFVTVQQLLDGLKGRLSHLDDQRLQLEHELRQVDAAGTVPDIDQLIAARARRDEAWRLIRAHHIEGKSHTAAIEQLQAATSLGLPELFEHDLHATDHIADERYRQANLVAKKEEILRQKRLLDESRDKLQCEQQAAESEHKTLQAAWLALWHSSQITPLAPSVMLEWLRLLETYQQKAGELRDARQTIVEKTNICDAFEASLRQTLADTETPIDRILHTARMKIDESKQIGGRRQEVAQAIEDIDARQHEVEARLNATQKELADWQQRWREQLAALSLPTDWDIAAIEQLLSTLEQVLHDDNIAGELRKRVSDMERERDAFDAAATQLAQELAPDLAAMPMVERVRQLSARCEAALQADARQRALSDDALRLDKEISTKSTRCEELSAKRLAMLQAVGAADEATFHILAQQAARRDALQTDLRSADHALSVARENEPASAFEQQLQTIDLHTIKSQRDELAKELQNLAQRIEELQVTSGKLQSDLARLHNAGDALVLQQTIESKRGLLRDHVQRWAALVMAEKMLDNALDRFQRENQPRVLEETKQLFQQMTEGEHVDIRHAAGDSFWLIDKHGTQRKPDQLSRGTREQLYLALRLAYVRMYCEKSEPLPLVMDDVLVNFDQRRAAQTLAALQSLSHELQIIFLTCHAPTVQLVEQACPGCHVLDLANTSALARA